MKKILCLVSAIAFTFTSCSKDDNDSSDSTSSILVKKITTTDNNGHSSSESYVYNGNKIVSMTEDNGSVTKYTYTGDLITKIEEFDMNGTLNLTTDYNYINGKLDNSIDKHPAESYYYKTKYTHNEDGTISYDQFRGIPATGAEEEYGATGKYTYKDGNVVKLEVSYYGAEYSYIYEYDTQNNPFKNVLGYNLLLDSDNTSANNITKQTSTYEQVNTYKYDENNFPIEKITNFSTGNETVEYAY